MSFIKSPLNYTGGKYKSLSQIIPLFPDNIDTFVDLFGGGFNVGINVKANKIIYNDVIPQLVELLGWFKNTEPQNIFDTLFNIIDDFKLSKSSEFGYDYYNCTSDKGLAKYNKEYYNNLREYYNATNSHPSILYTLIIYAYSNQIRFNSKKKFNTSCGVRDFNNSLQCKLHKFLNELQSKNIEFYNKDFNEVDVSKLTPNSLVYCDPPYLISNATYNENGGWSKEDDLKLMNYLDDLNSNGIKFALSNVFENKGMKNYKLIEWSDKYNVHDLKSGFTNSNLKGTKNRPPIVEVLITNY